jgi:hypothetical protein
MDFLPKYFALFEKYFKIFMWFKWLQNRMRFVNNIESENLHCKIDESSNLPEDISFISEHN